MSDHLQWQRGRIRQCTPILHFSFAAESRHRYYSAEEKAAMEQEENDRIAEEKRIDELKAKCARKGLSFEEEEAKYQTKLAAKKAKEEAKAAKKNKEK